jgi:hypothetical protein
MAPGPAKSLRCATKKLHVHVKLSSSNRMKLSFGGTRGGTDRANRKVSTLVSWQGNKASSDTGRDTVVVIGIITNGSRS